MRGIVIWPIGWPGSGAVREPSAGVGGAIVDDGPVGTSVSAVVDGAESVAPSSACCTLNCRSRSDWAWVGWVLVVSGTAEVLGHDLRTDAKAVRRRVGLLGHATMLYDELTVADNVRFWARAAKARPADAEAAMGELGLDGRLRDVAVARLSAG